MSRTSGSGGWVKIKLASDGDAAIDRLLLLAVVQQKNEEERREFETSYFVFSRLWQILVL